MVHSFQKQSGVIQPLDSADTLATAIAVPNPLDGIKALDAIYSTGGSAVAVSDQEILQAQYLLSTEEGLFVESAAAATVAALLKNQPATKISQWPSRVYFNGRWSERRQCCAKSGDQTGYYLSR